jgi:hypothetical protein
MSRPAETHVPGSNEPGTTHIVYGDPEGIRERVARRRMAAYGESSVTLPQ